MSDQVEAVKPATQVALIKLIHKREPMIVSIRKNLQQARPEAEVPAPGVPIRKSLLQVLPEAVIK